MAWNFEAWSVALALEPREKRLETAIGTAPALNEKMKWKKAPYIVVEVVLPVVVVEVAAFDSILLALSPLEIYILKNIRTYYPSSSGKHECPEDGRALAAARQLGFSSGATLGSSRSGGREPLSGSCTNRVTLC